MTAARIVVALVVLAGLAGAASAQPQDVLPAADGAETYLFRSLLGFQGVKPVQRLPRDQRKVILVLFGRITQARSLDETSAQLSRSVLNAGGAVLIATDQRLELFPYLPKPAFLNVAPLPGPMRQRPTVDNCLSGNRDMPFLIPQPLTTRQPNLLAMTQCRRVATNKPGCLEDVTQVGYLSLVLANLPAHTAGGYAPLPFAVKNDPTESPNGETAVVYADVGPFTNQMLAASGTNNLEYAFHLTKLLTDGPNYRRDQCLFVEDGVVKTDFDKVPLAGVTPPVPPLPVPSADEVIKLLEKKIDEVADPLADKFEKQNTIESSMAKNYRRIAEVVAIVVTVLVILAVWRRFWSGKHNPDQLPIPATAEPTTNVLDRRRQEMLRANDVTEPAREYLRDRFVYWGVPAGVAELPEVETLNEGKSDRAVRQALRTLWDVATGDGPDRVTFVRWKELEVMVETVDRAADAGRWRFTAGENV